MAKRPPPDTGAVTLPLAVSAKAARTIDPPISELIARAITTPGLISFAAGLVDQETLPVRDIAAICARLPIGRSAGAVLQYGTTQGMPALRQELVAHIAGLECKSAAAMGISADDVLVTNGSQQSLYLLAETLLDPGDIVIAANPSYFVFTGTLASFGVRIVTVPMDEHGMRVDEVERVLEKLARGGELNRVKFIYCTSFYQNPTGLSLSLPRRRALLELAQRYSRSHRILILEDAAYRELAYDGKRLPSIKSFDGSNQHTILTQTFSKPFAPGLRLGYTVMPPDVMREVLRQKGNHDFGSSNLTQWIALQAMAGRTYTRQVKRVCRQYQRKRDAMLKALGRMMPTGVSWTRPEGGLYVWVTMPPSIDTGPRGPLFSAAIAEGVMYVPGEFAYGLDEQGELDRHHLRLCFGQVRSGSIATGVRRLGRAMARVGLSEGGKPPIKAGMSQSREVRCG